MKRWVLPATALLVGVVLAVGCSREEAGIMVGYGDFVCLGGTTYEAVHPPAGRDAAGRVERSSAYARTKVQLQGGDIVRSGGRFRDGDAGQLGAGTPLYRLEGADPGFRLAARFDGRWQVYEARRDQKTEYQRSDTGSCSRG